VGGLSGGPLLSLRGRDARDGRDVNAATGAKPGKSLRIDARNGRREPSAPQARERHLDDLPWTSLQVTLQQPP